MGASKRMAELCLQALSEQLKDYQTLFQYEARFGSRTRLIWFVVIPSFFERIPKEVVPITITHPDIIRYFMTVYLEAAQAMLFRPEQMAKGGDVFHFRYG